MINSWLPKKISTLGWNEEGADYEETQEKQY